MDNQETSTEATYNLTFGIEKPIGFLNLYGGAVNAAPIRLSLSMYRKPNWFHLLMLKLCFGIYWTDKT